MPSSLSGVCSGSEKSLFFVAEVAGFWREAIILSCHSTEPSGEVFSQVLSKKLCLVGAWCFEQHLLAHLVEAVHLSKHQV